MMVLACHRFKFYALPYEATLRARYCTCAYRVVTNIWCPSCAKSDLTVGTRWAQRLQEGRCALRACMEVSRVARWLFANTAPARCIGAVNEHKPIEEVKTLPWLGCAIAVSHNEIAGIHDPAHGARRLRNRAHRMEFPETLNRIKRASCVGLNSAIQATKADRKGLTTHVSGDHSDIWLRLAEVAFHVHEVHGMNIKANVRQEHQEFSCRLTSALEVMRHLAQGGNHQVLSRNKNLLFFVPVVWGLVINPGSWLFVAFEGSQHPKTWHWKLWSAWCPNALCSDDELQEVYHHNDDNFLKLLAHSFHGWYNTVYYK